ncbi:hypothetical protein BDR04DRAFT_347344 [Suillus decipiens]|nr:hypothetical protein BDR04DRAFT_347344 [Suillus decipiens]
MIMHYLDKYRCSGRLQTGQSSTNQELWCVICMQHSSASPPHALLLGLFYASLLLCLRFIRFQH